MGLVSGPGVLGGGAGTFGWTWPEMKVLGSASQKENPPPPPNPVRETRHHCQETLAQFHQAVAWQRAPGLPEIQPHAPSRIWATAESDLGLSPDLNAPRRGSFATKSPGNGWRANFSGVVPRMRCKVNSI